MKRYIKIYFKFLINHIKTNMIFSYDFILGVIMMILMDIPYVFFMGTLFSGVDIAGWNLSEIMLLIGYVYITEGLYDLLHGEIMNLPALIISGGLDCYYIRPLNIIFQILTASFYPDAVSQIILGGILFVWAAIKLELMRIALIFQLFFFAAISVVLYMSISILLCSFSFVISTRTGFLGTFYSLEGVAKYPLSIFPKWFRYIFYTILPLAYIFYEPAQIILGKEKNIAFFFISLIVTVIITVLAFFLWNIFNISG